MFESKSPIVKVGGYIILGFFVLIIAVSFGMPDFMSRMGLDPTVIAIVNDEKVHRMDYLRFRDSKFRELATEKMEDMILNYYIGEVLLLQIADKYGFDVSEEKLVRIIRQMTGLEGAGGDAVTSDQFKMMLARQHMTTSELAKIFRDSSIREDFLGAVKIGAAVPTEDAENDIKLDQYKFKFKYSFVSISDIRKEYAGRLAVTDAEISSELASDKKEIKDPKTDKERIKKKIESRKMNEVKKEITDKVNKIAEAGGSLNDASAAMKGKISLSKEFKPGEDAKDEIDSKSLNSITSSDTFASEFFKIKRDASSKAIETPAGIYVFSPVKIETAPVKTDDTAAKKIEAKKKLAEEAAQSAIGNLMAKAQEKSKIVKNLKTD